MLNYDIENWYRKGSPALGNTLELKVETGLKYTLWLKVCIPCNQSESITCC